MRIAEKMIREILTKDIAEKISVVSELQRDGAFWVPSDTGRVCTLHSALENHGEIVQLTDRKEIFYDYFEEDEEPEDYELASSFWSNVDCAKEVKKVKNFAVTCSCLEDGLVAVRWARNNFCSDRVVPIKDDLSHVESMIPVVGEWFFIRFHQDGFPWVYEIKDQGCGWDELQGSDTILCAKFLDCPAEKTEEHGEWLFKKNDVVFYRNGSKLSVAYVVKPQKSKWYLGKDIFTKKCLLMTEADVDGANVIQGAKT